MPDLSFQVEGSEPIRHAAAPMLAFKLRVSNGDPAEAIQTVVLRAQIQIDAARRRYDEQEQQSLLDLFGEPERWGQTLRGMLWTFSTAIVLPFHGSTTVDLTVPCSYDFNVAATKYFYALDKGEVPLTLMFSGTVFYESSEGYLQVAQISWDKEATYRLPVGVWQQMMDHYYPNRAWIDLRRDCFDRLYQYKIRKGLPTWEQVVEDLLSGRAAT